MVIDLDKQGTQEQLAGLVGVSQQAISLHGIAPSTLGRMLLDYCHNLREVAAGRAASGGVDLAHERALLAREQRTGLELRNAIVRGEYAPISLLAEVLATASQAVAQRFDHLPGVLRKACPEMTEAQRNRVFEVVADARNEWVSGTAALVERSLAASDDEATTEPPQAEEPAMQSI